MSKPNSTRALPASEGRPPLIIVVDAGHTSELYSDAAFLAEGAATMVRDLAVKARDASLNRLRTRIVGLRNELEQLNEPDDVRAGSVAGEIIVEWPAAVGAEN